MGNPLVSIITITRNRANIISRAINSVLNQTYTNIEYIIVDGASTDETQDVVALFKDERLKYFKLDENLPIPETINYGFERSHGAYISFLDDDDEYLENKIERQIELISRLPSEYGMVYCWMSYFDNETGAFKYVHNCQLKGDVGIEVVERPTVSGTPTFLIKRDAFAQSGGWRNVGIVSDWEYGARFCQKYKVDFVPESLVKVYVNHGCQRMSDWGYYRSQNKHHIQFHKYFLLEYEDIFKKYPRKKIFHLYRLALLYFCDGQILNFLKSYFELMKIKPSLKNLFIPVRAITMWYGQKYK